MKRTDLRRGKPLARTGPPSRRTDKPLTRTQMRRRRRAKADEVLTDGFWQDRRIDLYARADGRCEWDGCSLDNNGLEAHHRKARSQGRDHSLANLAALAPRCHQWITEHPAEARARGFIVRSMQNPAEVPQRMHGDRLLLLTADGGYQTPNAEEAPR